MKCSECKKYVTDVYFGCTWCKLDDNTRAELDKLDDISEQVRDVAKATRNWYHAEQVIKLLAEARIELYDKAMKQLYAEAGRAL